MLLLILGIGVFLGAHTFTTLRAPRQGVADALGLGVYKGLYSVVALIGFVLICVGFSRYRADGLIPLWSPPAGIRHLTIPLMGLAFVSLAAMNPAPSRIRGWLRHPTLVAIKIWALAHCSPMTISAASFSSDLSWPGRSTTASPSSAAAISARRAWRVSPAPTCGR